MGLEALRLVAEGRLGAPAVVTHWDADGLVTASLFLAALAGLSRLDLDEAVVRVPESRSFSFGDLLGLEGAGRPLVVLDLSLPYSAWREALQVSRGLVVAVDHHRVYEGYPDGVYVVNPAAYGDPYGLWPSASYVLASHLQEALIPEAVAVGVAGDLGDASPCNPVFAVLSRLAGSDHDSLYHEAREAAEFLDSPHRLCRYQELPGIIADVARGLIDGLGLRAVTGIQRLRLYAEEVESEWGRLESTLRKRLTEADGCPGVYIVRLGGRGDFAGRLARRAASLLRGDAGARYVVVAYEWPCGDRGRVYVRPVNAPFKEASKAQRLLVEEWGRLGYPAGGKTQEGNVVAAATTGPGEPIDKALQAALRVLCRG